MDYWKWANNVLSSLFIINIIIILFISAGALTTGEAYNTMFTVGYTVLYVTIPIVSVYIIVSIITLAIYFVNIKHYIVVSYVNHILFTSLLVSYFVLYISFQIIS